MIIIDIKKIKYIMLVFIISTSFLYACQPTPSKQPVAAKGNLEEKLKILGVESKYEVSQSVSDEFNNTKGNITVKIDSDIIVPDITKYPVLKVKSFEFDEYYRDIIAAYFLKDTEKLYTKKYVLSKSYINTQISSLHELLKQGREKGIWFRPEEEILADITRLKTLLIDAPEEDERFKDGILELMVESDMNYINDPIFGWEEINLYKDIDSIEPNLFIRNYTRDISIWGYRGNYDIKTYSNKPIDSFKEDILRAEREAEEFLSAIGIKDRKAIDFTVYNAIKKDGSYVPCYQLSFRRNIEGVIVQDVQERGINSSLPADYSKRYSPEAITIWVVENEIEKFAWTNPDTQISILTENAALLPFEDIMDYAKNYVFYMDYSTKGNTPVVIINEIKLNYMRINRKDHDDEFLYVPVWDFMGHIKTPGMPTSIELDNECIVTVNAIDGSNIDRRVGY